MTRYAKLNALLDAVEEDDSSFNFGCCSMCVIGVAERIGALEVDAYSTKPWAKRVCTALEITHTEFKAIFVGYKTLIKQHGEVEASCLFTDKPFCIAYCRALIATWEALHAASTDHFTITESECANHS